jgi:hypothetical protein
MLKIFWAALAVSFAAFVFVTIQVGVGPRPIGVIKPSLAKEPAEIGFWIYRQLRHVAFKSQIIFLGFQDEKTQAEVARGFWESARNDGLAIDLVVKKKGALLSLPVRTNEFLDEKDLPALLAQVAPSAKKILVFLPSQDASHVVKDSIVHRVEVQLNQNIMSISQLEWTPDHPVNLMVQEHCEEAKSLTGFPDFNFFRCIYSIRKKKIERTKEQGKLLFVVDQFGGSDYVVLTYL